MRALILPACTLVALACGQPLFVADPPRPPVIPREPYFAPPASAAEVASITWGWTGCLGECPVYVATFRSSGVAWWRGQYPAKYLGADTTTIDTATFRHLAEQVMSVGFFEWEEDQTRAEYDIPSLTVAVTLADGRTKRIYGTGGPHLSLGFTFDSTAGTLSWHREARPFDLHYRLMVWRGGERAKYDSTAPR